MLSMSFKGKLRNNLGNTTKSLKTMKLLDKLVERKMEFDKKYQMVNMTDLIRENCQYEDQVKKVISCLEVLARYCENLLNPQALRPQKWLTISLHNQIFMEKVQPIKGHRKILEQIGYKKEEKGCLIHEGEDDLNVYVVAQVYLEIKAIQQELKLWVEGKHPFRELFEGLLESSNITLTPGNAKLFLKQQKEANQSQKQQQQQQQQQQSTTTSVEDKEHKGLHDIKRAPGNRFDRSKCAVLEMDDHRHGKSKTDTEVIKRRPVILNTFSTLVISKWVCDHCTAENEHFDKPCRTDSRPNLHDLQLPRRPLPHTCQVCYKTTNVFCPLEVSLLMQSRKSMMPEGSGLTSPPNREVDLNEGLLGKILEKNDDSNSRMCSGDSNSKMGSGDFNSKTGSGDFNSKMGSGDFNSKTGSGDFNSKMGSGDFNSKTGSGDFNSKMGSGDFNSKMGSGDFNSKMGSGDFNSKMGSGDFNSKTGSGDYNSKMKRIQLMKADETRLLWSNRLMYFIKILHKEVGQLPEEEIQYLFSMLQSKPSSDPANLILQNFDFAAFEVLREWKAAEEKTLGLLKDHGVYIDKTEGEGSVNLVRACLTESSGNPSLAFQKFMEKWKILLQMLKEECSIPDLSSNDYSDVLFKCGGVIEEAKVCLIKNRYTYAIWGQEGTNLEVGNDLYRDARLFDPFINKAVRDKNIPVDKRVRMLICECDIDDAQLAKQVVGLMDSSTDGEDLCIVDFLEALEQNPTKDAWKQLMKACPICLSSKPIRSFLKMPKCGCVVCKQCLKMHFEIKIKEGSISSMVCPMCSLPKIDNSYTDLDFFPQLTKLLSNILDESLVSKLGEKLAMWTLKDERVIHCPWNCGEQFIVDNIFLKVVKCSNCMKFLCLDCLNKWENDQHDCSSSHNEFKDLNLKACPKCRQPFYLVKGGCLHMKCAKCDHEFCAECNEPFLRQGCTFSEECLSMGFHCHHPRNCHFFMRDTPIKKLAELLQHYNVKIPEKSHSPWANQATSLPTRVLVKSPPSSEGRPQLVRSQSVCLSPIQRTDFGDEEICGQDLFNEELQLCCTHFVEYLCNIIKHKELDPVHIMTKEQLIFLLKKHHVKVPAEDEVRGDYRARLIQIVQVQIPLNNHSRPRPAESQVVVRRNGKSHGDSSLK